MRQDRPSNICGRAFMLAKIVIELSEDWWIHKSGWSYVFVFSVKEVAFRLDIQILTTRLSRL